VSVHLVIMAGGSGTRFWPKSTSSKPKQLLKLGSEKTLLKQTLDRFEGIISRDHQWIVTTQALSGAIQTEAGSHVKVLSEPQARNTAPCVYWASRLIYDQNPNAVLVFMPADHFIRDQKAFSKTVEKAIEWAKTHDDLITLGVQPTAPETGYGYLKVGDELGGSCLKVEQFVEKPNLERAQEFLKSKKYLWNGGMFVWKASVIMEAFDRAMPEMKKSWDQALGDVKAAYPKMTATSIDFGVMEKAQNVVSFPLSCGWDDVGAWTALDNLEAPITGDCVMIDARGNIVDSSGPLVSLLGVNNLIVVATDKVIMVADKSRAQDIKKLVDEVKKKRPDLV